MTPLQEHIYQILVVVDRLCEKHNIPYFLIGGTALGTLRHKGFIPWDDDADIGMFRPDFERFLKLCAKNLPEGYELRHSRVTSKFYVAFAQILNKRVWMQIKNGKQPPTRMNVYMDIFPLDNVPQNALKHRIQLLCLSFIKSLLEVKYFNHANPLWRNRMLVRFLRPLLPGGLLVKLYDWISTLEKSNTTRDVWHAYAQSPPERVTYQRQWMTQRRRAQFEHGEFWIPAEAELYCERTYGADYMKLPPLEKRAAHNAELLSNETPSNFPNRNIIIPYRQTFGQPHAFLLGFLMGL